jgi:branched-chain amino acid transport system substrate-binding protein
VGEEETYKIGALFAVTGPASPLGTPEKETAEMLEEEINAAGGVNGHPIEVIVYDTETDETKAVTLAKKLIEQDQVLAIIGPSTSGETLAIVDTVEQAEVPLVACAAATQIVDPVKKWVFAAPQTSDAAVQEIYDYAKSKGIDRVAIMTASDGFGDGGKESLEKFTDAKGITIVATESFGKTDTDMTPQLTKISGTDAQAVIVWGTNPGPAVIAKNMKQLNMEIPLFQSHGVANSTFIELAGDAANGVILPAGKLMVHQDISDDDPQKEVLTEYAEAFQAEFEKPANTFGGHAYDALYIVTGALEKAGSDKAKLRDEIEKTDFVGTAGVFQMSAEDHNGLGKGSFVMIEIVDGTWTQAQ